MSAQPVTKDDLDRAIEQSESRLAQRIDAASEHTARVTIDYTDHAIEQSESRLRGEIKHSESCLRGEIERTESRLMQRIAEASEHTARVMMDRMDRIAGELATRIDELPERMGHELARHIRASDERNLDAIRTIDDQYRGLPGQVATLRSEVDACCGPGGEAGRLRRDVDAHVRDDARHLDPAQAPRTKGANDSEA